MCRLEETEMEKRIITISREFGSGGRFIGEEVAKKLGIAYYDKNIISHIAEESGLSPDYIQEKAELSPKKGLFAYAFAGRDITGKSVEDMVYEAQRKVILDLAKKEPCVIIGRNADYILKDRDDVLNVIRYKRADIFEKQLHGLFIYRLDDNGVRRDLPWRGNDEGKMAYPTHFEYEKFELNNPTRYWWTNGFDPKWYLSPFPSTEVNKGYGLVQNPGW